MFVLPFNYSASFSLLHDLVCNMFRLTVKQQSASKGKKNRLLRETRDEHWSGLGSEL